MHLHLPNRVYVASRLLKGYARIFRCPAQPRPRRHMAVTAKAVQPDSTDIASTNSPSTAVDLKVYAMDGRMHRLPFVVGATTVAEIRTQVAQQTGINPDEVRLAYGGRELERAMDQALFSFKSGIDVLHAMQRMTGGGGRSGLSSSLPADTAPSTPEAAPAAAEEPRARVSRHRNPSYSSGGREAAATGGGDRGGNSSRRSRPIELFEMRPRIPTRAPRAPGARPGDAASQLAKQFRDLLQHPIPGVSAGPRDDDLMVWDVQLAGPEGTPYAGGWFKVELHFSERFPGEPPKATFITPMWHPNIGYSTGHVCVDFMQPSRFGWTVCSVPCVLSGLQMLLRDSNPDSPMNREAAAQLKYDPVTFESKVRRWTQQFAT